MQEKVQSHPFVCILHIVNYPQIDPRPISSGVTLDTMIQEAEELYAECFCQCFVAHQLPFILIES
jgi:hypothetical protein